MMKRIVTGAVFLGAAAVIAYSSVRSAVAVAGWVSASEHAATYGATTFLHREIRTEVESLRPLASADRAVVFVVSPQCAVCSANMANWTDMIVELKRAGIPMFAVAPAHVEGLAGYWAGFDAAVPIITAEPEHIASALDVEVTPATLVVRRGTVRAVVPGLMSEPTRRQILRFATGLQARPVS